MYKFILTDLMGETIGELTDASDRTVSSHLFQIPTAGFTLPLRHSLVTTLLNTPTLLQVWKRDGGTTKIVFHGPVRGVHEQGDSNTQSVAVTAAGAQVRLQGRVVDVSVSGTQDPTLRPADILSVANSTLYKGPYGFTGITNPSDTGTFQVGSTPIIKYAYDAMMEWITALNNYEFTFIPTAPVNVGKYWPQICTFVESVSGGIGTDRSPEVVFEYGTSRANIASYEHVLAYDGLATRAYIGVSDSSVTSLPSNTPESPLTSTAIQTQGLWETIVSDSGIQDFSLRQSIMAYHLAVRQQPRDTVKFTLTRNATPAPFTSFDPGDLVRARAVVNGAVRFDVIHRVWGISVSLDNNGNESAELDLNIPYTGTPAPPPSA